MLQISSVHPNQGYYSDKQPLSHADQPQLICYHNFYSRQFRINGIIQIILGVICIVFNAVSLGLEPGGWGVFAQGFWSGAFYIATGSVGVAAANKKTKCEIIGFMVLCIITASIISPGALVTSLFGCITYQDDYEGSFDYKDGYEKARLAFQIIMGLMPIIQFAMAVWGAVISSKAVCGNVKMITPLAQLRGDQQFVVQNSDGKTVPYQGLPSHLPPSGYNVYGGQQY